MALDVAVLAELAPRYLERQEWFSLLVADDEPAAVTLASAEVLREGPPGLARLVLDRGELHLQLLVGWRPSTELAGVLRNEDRSLLGSANDGAVLLYDALADDELMRTVLDIATQGRERGRLVRPVATLVSHASLVFDERLFMKIYRVLEHGPRPEVEVLFRLDEVGFNAILAPYGRWREEDFDLVLVREFQPSALEGRLLALTSLRDLLAHASEGDERVGGLAAIDDLSDADAAAAAAGGDLSAEMLRLGETTARLHLALAEAFGAGPLPPSACPAGLGADAGRCGPAIQLHGDFHLRRVMRGEAGWLVTGFGDDPLYATTGIHPSLPLRTGSCLEDVADMSFAIGRVAAEALAQRPPQESEVAAALCTAWTQRNRGAFLRGYLRAPGIDVLLPAEPELRERLLSAFEAERVARYEATSAL